MISFSALSQRKSVLNLYTKQISSRGETKCLWSDIFEKLRNAMTRILCTGL